MDRAQELRQKNPDVHAEMDNIRRQMDALSHEIDKLTANPSELQENFERFGYGPHVRAQPIAKMTTYDEETMNGTLANSGDHVKDSGSHKNTTIPIYKHPVLRQYVSFVSQDFMLTGSPVSGTSITASCTELDLQKRSSATSFSSTYSTWASSRSLEIRSPNLLLRSSFSYLPYVNLELIHIPEMLTLKAQATFIPSWKIWSGIGQLISQFDTDDLTQRGIVLLILACLVGLTTVSRSLSLCTSPTHSRPLLRTSPRSSTAPTPSSSASMLPRAPFTGSSISG